MIKSKKLVKGDKVAIVSLSSGILGESFIAHELDLGKKRLKEWGLEPVFMPNSLKGLDFIASHPEARAEDLITAFKNTEIKAIICAIGGYDTYRLLPYLLNDEFKQLIQNNPKIFMGFSDTTTNHLMFQKLGLNTFYGPAFITDFAEFEPEMLPYTKNAVKYLFDAPETYEITSSSIWYDDRTDFSPTAVGTLRIAHDETKGYELLQGKNNAIGKLLGGCLDVLASHIGIEVDNNEKGYDMSIIEKFPVFPTLEEWKNKIFFFETSESKMEPEYFKKVIQKLKKMGVFNQINGVLVGKPIDEIYYDEYKQILKEELAEFDIPVLINLNFGHSYPRMVLPYGATAEIDVKNKTLTLLDSILI